MLILLTTLLGTLSSMFRSRAMLELENLALRHQVGVLQRSARKRPRLTPADRLLWVGLSRLWRDWRSALAIVKPETVVAWHRAGFRRFWTWKVRRGHPGRPHPLSVGRQSVREIDFGFRRISRGNIKGTIIVPACIHACLALVTTFRKLLKMQFVATFESYRAPRFPALLSTCSRALRERGES